MEIKDYDKSGLKNKTAIRLDVKARAVDFLKDIFIKAVGEDNVSMVRVGSDVETTVLAAVIGTITDKDGFSQEICITIDPVVKAWEDGAGDKRKIERFDRFEAEEAYKLYSKQKEEKAKKKVNKEISKDMIEEDN